VIAAALLLAAATPPTPYWEFRHLDPYHEAHVAQAQRLQAQHQRDHSNYEEAVQEQIDDMPDGDRKTDLQDKLDSYESDENYPEYQKDDREDVEDAIEDCDDCDDPDDAGDPD
jgi:hypothetical protein